MKAFMPDYTRATASPQCTYVCWLPPGVSELQFPQKDGRFCKSVDVLGLARASMYMSLLYNALFRIQEHQFSSKSVPSTVVIYTKQQLGSSIQRMYIGETCQLDNQAVNAKVPEK